MKKYVLENKFHDEDDESWLPMTEPLSAEELLAQVAKRFKSFRVFDNYRYRVVEISYEEVRKPL